MAVKVICTGHIIEVYTYEKEPYGGNNKREVDPMTNYLLTGDESFLEKKDKPEWLKELEKKTKTRKNGHAARASFRRLVQQNFTGATNFITLTFHDWAKTSNGDPIDITDIKECNKAFDVFMKRLRRMYGAELKYVVVVEFQKRGAVHYHMLADLGLDWRGSDKGKECQERERWFGTEIWKNGFVDLKNVKHVDNLGAYLSKYMVKRMDDDRLAGKKAYRGSQNLERPLVLKGEEAEELIRMYNLAQKREVSANEYESEYLGQITYKQFNLKREKIENNT